MAASLAADALDPTPLDAPAIDEAEPPVKG